MDDDWNPDDESFIEYTIRKMREAGDARPQHPAPGQNTLATQPSATWDADYLEQLMRLVRDAPTLERQVTALRMLASWADQEADLLQAGGRLNFHRSSELH